MRTLRTLLLLPAALLLASTLAAAAAPLVLTYHAKPGDKAVYTETATVKSTRTGTTAPGTNVERAQFRWSVTFAKAPAKGGLQATGRLLSGSAQVNGEKPQQAGAYTARYVLTPQGETTRSEMVAGEPLLLSLSGAEFGPFDVLVPSPLPKQPVKVGDMWTTDHRKASPGNDLDLLASTSKLLGETTYAGRKCLQIRTHLQDTLRDKASGVTASIDGTVLWLFDPQAGVALRSDTTGKQVTEIRQGSRRATVTATVDQHVRLTEWNGRKVDGR